MPQGNYGPGNVVFIYDLSIMRFGTITNYRSGCTDGKHWETYGVQRIGDNATTVCSPPQLRRAVWTFAGPMVIQGDDVDMRLVTQRAYSISPTGRSPAFYRNQHLGQPFTLQNPAPMRNWTWSKTTKGT